MTDIPPQGSVLFVVTGEDSRPNAPLTHRWSVDGTVAGNSPSFMYIPGIGDVGTHLVEVSVSNTNGETCHQWTVHVRDFQIQVHSGNHGSIVPAGEPSGIVSAAPGISLTFQILPENGYEILDVCIDGVSHGTEASPVFRDVKADHAISAQFTPMPAIHATATEGGSINPSGSLHFKRGSTQTFTITPDLGYILSDVLVDGESVGAVKSCNLENITSDRSITALFSANAPPAADAGPNQNVPPGAVVVLSAGNSFDPDGGISSFKWDQVGGPKVSLSDPERARSIFIAPSVGPEGTSLVFRLTVADHEELESADTCIVNVVRENRPPVAHAGFSQVAGEGETVVLDAGGSYDPDTQDRIVSYEWEQLDGPWVDLSNPNAVQSSFVVEGFGEDEASMKFRLTVTDGGGLKSSDACIVNIIRQNDPPIASVGPDQTAFARSHVMLDGSRSLDVEGPIAYYRWSQTRGDPVLLSDPKAPRPTFIAPVVEGPETKELAFLLTVTNNSGLRATSLCAITVISPLTMLIPEGGEEWRAGEPHTISWSYTGGDPKPLVKIELWKGDNPVTILAEHVLTGDNGCGSHEWMPPDSQDPGPNYRIRITSSITGGGGYGAMSEVFSLAAPAPPTPEDPTAEAPPSEEEGEEKSVQEEAGPFQ